jgi:hypothetical protein
MEDLEEERQKIANEVTRSRNVPIMAEYTIDFDWVLLHLTGPKSLTANSEIGIHTTPGLS